MAKWKMAGLGLVVLGLVSALGAWLMRAPIAMAVMARAFDRGMAGSAIDTLPDALSVGLCGSGSPLPDPTRAGPCAVVVAGRRMFIIDSGQGSAKNLNLMSLPPAMASALFITHYHSDHIADVGEVLLQHWGAGAATSPLPIYGPTGLNQVISGFEQAYRLDRGYRIAHHGPKVMPPSGFGGAPHVFAISAGTPDVLLINDADLKVYAVPVNHEPVSPAVGYVFIYKDRKVVISGDTAPSSRLEAAARGADVLVHEGLARNLVDIQRRAALRRGRWNVAQILHDILSYHSSPEQAAVIAERAHVKMLLFTHIIPPLPFDALDGPYLGDAPRIFLGRIRVGHDGDFVTLPTGSTKIRLTKRLGTWN